MLKTKRIFDLTFALLLIAILLPFLAILLIIIWAIDGRPLFYCSERMKTPTQSFRLWKLRTMRVERFDSGVSGGDKSSRITATGHVLRRFRFDEIPQLWNIIMNDMSFVGPRPPLRQYVEQFPDLYKRVLSCQPGLTGLATLVFYQREEQLLKKCKTKPETEIVYQNRCVPTKAKLDCIYKKNQSLCFDFKLMVLTVFHVFNRK